MKNNSIYSKSWANPEILEKSRGTNVEESSDPEYRNRDHNLIVIGRNLLSVSRDQEDIIMYMVS